MVDPKPAQAAGDAAGGCASAVDRRLARLVAGWRGIVDNRAATSPGPELERLRSIVEQVLPRFILASSSNQVLASRLSHDAVVVVVNHDLTTAQYGQQQVPTAGSLPAVSPSDVLYGSSLSIPFSRLDLLPCPTLYLCP